MENLMPKLNYKDQERIAVLNPDEDFIHSITSELKNVTIDNEVDPRFPYSFMIIFVMNVSDVERIAPKVLHNLTADGVLWFCYPKKTSKRFKSDIDRDHGWKVLTDAGLHGIRMVSINQDWSAFRFRNAKYIKSTNERFTH